jgi:hypothetical protein
MRQTCVISAIALSILIGVTPAQAGPIKAVKGLLHKSRQAIRVCLGAPPNGIDWAPMTSDQIRLDDMQSQIDFNTAYQMSQAMQQH